MKQTNIDSKTTLTLGAVLAIISVVLTGATMLKNFATTDAVAKDTQAINKRIDEVEQRQKEVVQRLDRIYELLTTKRH